MHTFTIVNHRRGAHQDRWPALDAAIRMAAARAHRWYETSKRRRIGLRDRASNRTRLGWRVWMQAPADSTERVDADRTTAALKPAEVRRSSQPKYPLGTRQRCTPGVAQ
jgi:hypothetical protein